MGRLVHRLSHGPGPSLDRLSGATGLSTAHVPLGRLTHGHAFRYVDIGIVAYLCCAGA
ncbi:hypothetical protein F750_5654 [Streptomyces sp. PAMC 26508]|nr:hypothetical protein F750_5654 [Streptomyces sp. PAMC 26508]